MFGSSSLSVSIVVTPINNTDREKNMTRISPERKSAALAKLLPPYNMPVVTVAQMEGILEATLYNWCNQAKKEGNPSPMQTKSQNNGPLKPGWPSLLKQPRSVPLNRPNVGVKKPLH